MKKLVFCLVMLQALLLRAQEFTGYVRKADSLSFPIYQAKVDVTENGKPYTSIKTYFNGQYKFNVQKNQTYTVSITYPGYTDTSFTVKTDKNARPDPETLTIKLTKDGMRLLGVIRSREEEIPIQGATIIIRDIMTRKEQRHTTGIDGSYNFKLEYETNYRVSIDKRSPGVINVYKDTSFYVSTVGYNQPLDYKLDIFLEPYTAWQKLTPRGVDTAKAASVKTEKPVVVVGQAVKQPFVEEEKKKETDEKIAKLQAELEAAKRELEALKKNEPVAKAPKKEVAAKEKTEKSKPNKKEPGPEVIIISDDIIPVTSTIQKAETKTINDTVLVAAQQQLLPAAEPKTETPVIPDMIDTVTLKPDSIMPKAPVPDIAIVIDTNKLVTSAVQVTAQAEIPDKEPVKGDPEQISASVNLQTINLKDTAISVAETSVNTNTDTITNSKNPTDKTPLSTKPLTLPGSRSRVYIGVTDEFNNALKEVIVIAKTAGGTEVTRKLTDIKGFTYMDLTKENRYYFSYSKSGFQYVSDTLYISNNGNPITKTVVLHQYQHITPSDTITSPDVHTVDNNNIISPPSYLSKGVAIDAAYAIPDNSTYPSQKARYYIQIEDEKGMPVHKALVSMNNLTRPESIKKITDNKGFAVFDLYGNCTYTVNINKVGYLQHSDTLASGNVSKNFEKVNYRIESIPEQIEYSILPYITFEKGSAVISGKTKNQMKELIQSLVNNPASKIKIYAMASADEEQAMLLSLRRADAFIKLLVSTGVPVTRIESFQYGNDKSRNNCIWPDCTPEQLQENRCVLWEIKMP